MSEKHYRICLTAPLGARNGTLVLSETGGRVEGWLNVMNEKIDARGYFLRKDSWRFRA